MKRIIKIRKGCYVTSYCYDGLFKNTYINAPHVNTNGKKKYVTEREMQS